MEKAQECQFIKGLVVGADTVEISHLQSQMTQSFSWKCQKEVGELAGVAELFQYYFWSENQQGKMFFGRH
jgi:hypothetical protein